MPLEGLVARCALPTYQSPTSHPNHALDTAVVLFSIICDGNDLEMYNVKQEGSNLATAFVASEAGKVSMPKIPFVSIRDTNC